jgi:serine/threonine-protein kinase
MASESIETYTCPRCGSVSTKARLVESKYVCRSCSLEVAYLDLAPSGTMRSVLGWLQPVGTLLRERYLVSGMLGKGGFGATYLVQDTLIKKRRALKEIPTAQYDEQETDILSRLNHPAIPDIMDRFEVGAMSYLLLEFGGNRTLETERRTAGGTIPVPRLLPWMRELCEVLAYLHGQDPPIVHRDLKPDNILLDERDHIMLIDFGIAKESGGFAETRILARSASYGFSPPEQVMSTGTDQRSDVYALGATMYALLTGTIPVAAHDRVTGTELRPPSALNPAIPAALDAAIMQAMELNVNRRQQSIGEFGGVLDSGGWVDGGPGGPSGPKTVRVDVTTTGSSTSPTGSTQQGRPARRSPAVAIAVAGTLIVLAGVGLWVFQRPPRPGGAGGTTITQDVTPSIPVPEPTPEPINVPDDAARRAMEEARRKAQEEAEKQEVPTQEVAAQQAAPSPVVQDAAAPPAPRQPPKAVKRPARKPAADEGDAGWDIIYKGTQRTP